MFDRLRKREPSENNDNWTPFIRNILFSSFCSSIIDNNMQKINYISDIKEMMKYRMYNIHITYSFSDIEANFTFHYA